MKLKTNLLVLLCLSAFLGFLACKPSANNPSPAGYSGGLLCVRTSGEAFHYYYIDSAFDAFAQFTTSPGGSVPAWVDSVTINGMPMEPDGDSVGYMAGNYLNTLNFSAGANWVVTGANGIPSFSYNDMSTFPSYTAMPDTMDKAMGFTFPFNSTAAPAADSLTIQWDGPSGGTNIRGLSGSGITLTATELSAMNGDSTVIVLNATARHDQVFGGQRFAFFKMHTYYKTVYLK